MDIVKIFAHNVRQYRLKRQMSQEELAEKSGMHRTYISAVERQKRSISLGNIQKIANALNVETYLLFINNEDKEP